MVRRSGAESPTAVHRHLRIHPLRDLQVLIGVELESMRSSDVVSEKVKASFVEPMLLLRSNELPDDDSWIKELKLDGYRALAIKTDGKVQLRSRNDKDFTIRYPSIAKALTRLPNETVVDGELVVLDEKGRPSFNALQNYESSSGSLIYYLFDLLILSGRNVMGEIIGRSPCLA